MWILKNFQEHLFYRTHQCDCFWTLNWRKIYQSPRLAIIFITYCSILFNIKFSVAYFFTTYTFGITNTPFAHFVTLWKKHLYVLSSCIQVKFPLEDADEFSNFCKIRMKHMCESLFVILKTLQKQPPEVFRKKGFLKNFIKFTGKHLCQSLFFNKAACNFIKKETLVQVLSCEYY